MISYIKVVILIAAFVAGWTANGWRIGENIAEAEAQRARATIEVERLNIEKADIVSTLHAAEAAAQVAKARVIVKEVIKYVQSDNNKCDLSDEWVHIHDDSTGVPSDTEASAGTNDSSGKTKTDADALITVTENYATCIANSTRLESLQKWAESISN